MLITWSSRERNRSCSPLSRRSRGRIEPLRSSPRAAENHGFGFEGIPNFKLQENRRRSPNSRQIQSLEFPQFPLPINRFRILHGRLITIAFEIYSDAALTSAHVSRASVPDPTTVAIAHALKRG